MPEIWVMNASPLIVLGKANLLGIISPLARKWIIPEQVIQEVGVKQSCAPYLAELASGAALIRQEAVNILPAIAGWELGAGESAVLTIAVNTPETGVVLDDLLARKCATMFGLPLIGSIGLILSAKQRGLLPLVRPALMQIIQAGLYVHPAFLRHILEGIGEWHERIAFRQDC